MRRSASLIVALALCGCGDSSLETKNLQQKAGEAWDAMKDWSVAKKDEFLQKSGPMLESMKQKLSEKSGDTAKSAQEDWKVVEQKFAAMKEATGDQWPKARDAFREAYDALKKKLGL